MANNTTDAPNNSTGGAICAYNETDGTKVAKALAYVFVIIISLVGNTLIVAVVAINKRMQTPVNFFVLNMSVSDLLITIFFMPRMLSRIFFGVEWQIGGLAGLVLCKVSPSMQELCSSLSVLLFIAVAVDRFLAVILPLKKLITKQVSYFIILGIWVLAVSLRLPIFYGLNLIPYRGKIYCAFTLADPVSDKIYKHFAFVIFYAIPLCIVVILYTAIVVALKKRKRPGASSLTQQNIQLRRTHRVLRMLVTVVISFSICWFFYFCLPVLNKYLESHIICSLYFLRFFLCHLNCAFNPMVYLIFIENYRRGVRRIFARVFPKRHRANTVHPDDDRSTSEMRNVNRARSSTIDIDKSYVIEDSKTV